MHPLAKSFYGEMRKDDGRIFKKIQVNRGYHLNDMDKKFILHEAFLKCLRGTIIPTGGKSH